MEVITVEVKAFKEIQTNLRKISSELEKGKIKSIEDTWLSSKQVQKILGISQKTWQTYRDKKMIKFSQVGQKIYVKYTWLDEFLQSYLISSKEGAQK